MSLKAKLEAVIYAAEEPVTLAQLAALFPDEVLAEISSAESSEAGPNAVSETSGEGETSPEFWSGAETSAPAPEGAAATPEPSGVDGGTFASTEAAAPSLPEDRVQEDRVPEDQGPEDQGPGSQGEATRAAAEKQEARLRERRIRAGVKQILDALMVDYAAADRGMEIREVAGGYRMATKPEYHDAVRGFVKSLKPPLKLSLPALETLAVVAYKQPVTAPEVSEIRGVDSGGVLGSLISRKLVATAGRKQVIGRPILYKTTREFLLRFGLKDLGDLPSMEEFEKMAGELAESDEQTDVPPGSENLPFTSPELSAGQVEEAVIRASAGGAAEEDVSPGGASAEEQTESLPAGQPTSTLPGGE